MRFYTAADFYEAKIIASTTGWRRITREGEERGEREVTVREEGIEYSAVEAIEMGVAKTTWSRGFSRLFPPKGSTP